MAVVWGSLFALPRTTEWWTEQDNALLQQLVEMRTATLTTVAEALHSTGSEWFVRFLRIGTLVALVVVRRWRHFFAVLLSLAIVELSVDLISEGIGRPRPFVPIIGSWNGPAHPSGPVASLAVTLSAMALTLVPRGRRRNLFFVVSGAAVTALGLARMYLGVDHASDVVVAGVFAPAVAVVVFRLFAPAAVFPVTWKRGVTAHLDITGARGDAIRRAMDDQLGMEVLAIEPFGLEGSGGSTPLRLLVAGEPDTYVFAKLYSQTHLRSDRWYKLARAILYGSLEDEVRFASVRRLVEYEDYIQRLMRDAGISAAEPFGIVEITPEREYLMVSEFLEGARELTDADVDDETIDAALGVIRNLWDAGLAHRDIKPANVMVADRQVVLIDVAFGTVRPSPWRQAVDLANMMIILGLRVPPATVYERALLQFSPDDIAEAFAATRSITIPSQSRSSLSLLKKERGIDVLEQFRKLAPRLEPISIQRWSPRRIALTVAAILLALLLMGTIVDQVTGTGFL